MPSLSRSIGLAVTASALVLLTACGGGGAPDAAPSTAVADPVVTFPPLTRTASAAPTTEAPPTETATVVVTRAVPGDATPPPNDSSSGPVYVDPELFRSPSQSGHDYGFVSPTGNVACAVSASGTDKDQVTCQARDTVAPKDGSTCASPDRTAITAFDMRSEYICKPADYVAFPGLPVLDYGQVLIVGYAGCTSNVTDGITCTMSGAGLRLSRDVNDAF